jgi:TPR repeat protein
MEEFVANWDLENNFEPFERAAAKGHEESIFIWSVVKDVEMKMNLLKEAFARTEEPLGWNFAGELSGGREAFDFWKKSAEGGCSWGQVWYGMCFKAGEFVEKDMKAYVEWLEKAANQNNPEAMDRLGRWFRFDGNDEEKAVSYNRDAAELGWKRSMYSLAGMLKDGEGCARDLRQAAIWSAQAKDADTIDVFWTILGDAREAFNEGTTNDLTWNFDQLCYSLGWGLYWYQYDGSDFCDDEFLNLCLDYYCSCVELQQKSTLTFLFCWNRTVGVKDIGRMIGKMVWEEREDNLVKQFEIIEEEPKQKRIKN